MHQLNNAYVESYQNFIGSIFEAALALRDFRSSCSNAEIINVVYTFIVCQSIIDTTNEER